jgi:hypothetical protein
MRRIIVNTDGKAKNLFKLHRISQMWISELEFFFDEQHFYQDLIELYLLDLLKGESLDELAAIEKKLKKAVNKGNLLLLEVRTHEKQLATLFESEHLKGEKEFRNLHKKLANKFDQFVDSNKRLKKVIFDVIKKVMQKHKQKLLMAHLSS